jgi:hypothetical protein
MLNRLFDVLLRKFSKKCAEKLMWLTEGEKYVSVDFKGSFSPVSERYGKL